MTTWFLLLEKYPLQKLDINVFYCEICGFLYIYDTDKQLDPIVNIKTKLLLPKLRSVIFGIDTRLIKSVNGILDKVREEEEIYSK